MSFTDKKLEEVWKDLIQCDNDNTGLSSTLKTMKTGNGDSSVLSLSTRQCSIDPALDTTGTFLVKDVDGNALVTVDSTNDLVKFGVGQHIANTQYATFGIGHANAASYVANYHYPLSFAGTAMGSASVQDNLTFGAGTDPATTFTTADATATDAALLVTALWLVPDNITIDAVYSLEGGDNATGATTRMHLMSYDFTSGSTSALTNGTLLAQNGSVTNAGSEQLYKSTWSLDSADINADKVIVATFLTTDVTGDYAAAVTVKYHNR